MLIGGKYAPKISPAGVGFVNNVSPDRIPETIAKDLDHDRRLDLSTTTDTLLPSIACHFTQVADRHYPDYVGFARWYYRRRQFPLYQIVWPNNDGHYPWSFCATKAFKEWQPVLGAAPTTG